MSEQAAFERVLASLYDDMLDDTHWSATSALIDEACGLTGNALLVPEGPPDDIRVLFVGLYYRGPRRLGGLGIVADRHGPAAHATCPSIHPRPAGAGQRPSGGQNPRIGVLHLDQGRLARLVAEALPTSGAVPVSGSMLLGRVSRVPPFVVHVKPVGVPQPDYGARHVAALVLLVEPGRHPRLDPDVVTRTLGLTPAESQVVVLVDRRQERARHRPDDGAHGRCHLLAPDALPQGSWTVV